MTRSQSILIENVTICTENELTSNSSLLLSDGIIQAINPECRPSTAKIIDGSNLYALPGFIDTHIHGAYGADVMDATEFALDTIARALPKEGTTSFLATTITQSKSQIEKALINAANYRAKENFAEMIGIHLEGPFIEQSKKGAQPEQHILKPDIELFKRWQQLSNNSVKQITLAPEHDKDGSFISLLSKDGVNISVGHSSITYRDLKKAVRHGVRHVTHLCNAMPSLHHREVGTIGAAFLLQELYAEIIADNIHVSKEMLQIIYNNIGSDRLIIITDAMKAKGMQNGTYELGGQTVNVLNNKATLPDGTLAGSLLKMNEAAKNLLALNGVTLQDIVKMTSVNPAKTLSIFDEKGSIHEGKDADIVLLDRDFRVKYTICRGSIVYRGE
ncbi:N-acetylglucosamine-6-phosphate deacetylase [Virgibacillus sp. W0181]|uniref:N-acetylglucosamine-6-phosphate deacetylase n=1 Tax=Virgibacillus sp. W0181 TaxID=3391581 RepID=UPI003F489B3B